VSLYFNADKMLVSSITERLYCVNLVGASG